MSLPKLIRFRRENHNKTQFGTLLFELFEDSLLNIQPKYQKYLHEKVIDDDCQSTEE